MEDKKAIDPRPEEAKGDQTISEEELELVAGGVEHGRSEVQFGDYHVVGNDYYICKKCGHAVTAKEDKHVDPIGPIRP